MSTNFTRIIHESLIYDLKNKKRIDDCVIQFLISIMCYVYHIALAAKKLRKKKEEL